MLNDSEEKYVEKWSGVQSILQFHKRVIVALLGLAGFFALIAVVSNNQTPIVVEKHDSLFESLVVSRDPVVISEKAVGDLATQFIRLRYEWASFDPEAIVKQLEPLTTEGLRSKLLLEFGSKAFENKSGNSIEQSVARIRPVVTDKEVMAEFDRILRVNGVPVVVPTQVSLQLSEGPKTSLNPLGLFVNGVIEHEDR